MFEGGNHVILKVVSPQERYKDLATYRDLTKYCLNPEKRLAA